MSPIQLTPEQIQSIISYDQFAKNGYPPPAQHGPLRYQEKGMRCLHTGYYVGGILRDDPDEGGKRQACHAPTNWTFKGEPICSTHALYKMNQLLHELSI